MQQIILIHGADSFEKYDDFIFYLKSIEITNPFIPDQTKGWKENLQSDLGPDYAVATLKMPNKLNARYEEWKIWFEKCIPFVVDDIILAGHSMGGVFLAKYLSENIFPKKIKATFLIAPPFDFDSEFNRPLNEFALVKKLDLFEKQGGLIYFYFSKDDPIVSKEECKKYQSNLPSARVSIYKDKGHFWDDHFPELVKEIISIKD